MLANNHERYRALYLIQSNLHDLYYGGFCFEAGHDMWVSREKAHQYDTEARVIRVILLNALQATYREV